MATKFSPNPKSKPKNPNRDSFIESMRDIGQGSFDSFRDDLVKETPKDFIRQLLGLEKGTINASGELKAGESIVIDKVLEEEREENKILRAQLAREQFLRRDQESYVSRQTQELKLELKAIHTETEKIAKETLQLSQEVKIAVMQAPVKPGVYHLRFFQNLLSFMQSFRKKIHEANLWLQSANKRAQRRKTFWGQVSKGGAQRLLSGEDYSQRSAG